MKTYILTATLFLSMTTFAQRVSQNIRGYVYDQDSQQPLSGVVISTSNVHAISNQDGYFVLEKIPTGRLQITTQHIGYEPSNTTIFLHSGKEGNLKLGIKEATISLDTSDLVLSHTRRTKVSSLGMRRITPEETNRYPGGFNDPSRILANFAGVNNSPSGTNDIIVRGNSPKYVQWKIEGIQFTNPNHFADQNGTGTGGMSMLNNNLLTGSNFYTGAFEAEHGNVLSGIYDVKLREGNQENHEFIAGVGLIGTDLTIEGGLPWKNASYLANYRYSTIGLINDMGLVDLEGEISFQDGTFKLAFPTQKMGKFFLFGIGGKSTIDQKEVTPQAWILPGNESIANNESFDFNKETYAWLTGLKHQINLSPKWYWETTLAYHQEGIEEASYENKWNTKAKKQLFFRTQMLDNEIKNRWIRTETNWTYKLSSSHLFKAGLKYHQNNFNLHQRSRKETKQDWKEHLKMDGQMAFYQSYLSWKYRLSDVLILKLGTHLIYEDRNEKSEIEPRASLKWKMTSAQSLHFAYGRHSNLESSHHYFATDEKQNRLNPSLGFLKADHYLVGYQMGWNNEFKLEVDLYYQSLFDLPVENAATSTFATINETTDYKYVPLVNEGKGKNYGVEFSLTKYFDGDCYFLLNGSLYDSKFKTLEGKYRNTLFNNRYLANFIFGKSFLELGENKNQSLLFNAKIWFRGGQPYVPVDVATKSYDYSKAYEKSYDGTYDITVSATYRWSFFGSHHELTLNLQNLTGEEQKLSEFYDESEENKIGYVKQFGFFPNLLYRFYF